MELWIRSQNRECLIKVNDIAIEQNMIVGYFDKDTEYEYLGQYKTKERALEVLDEIQNILMPKYIINSKSIKFSKPYEENGMILMDCNTNARLEQLSTYVYEMPKE